MKRLRQTFCRHQFRLGDQSLTGIPEPEMPEKNAGYDALLKYHVTRDQHPSHTKRVQWPCAKCGKMFYRHCGLEILEHGELLPDLDTRQTVVVRLALAILVVSLSGCISIPNDRIIVVKSTTAGINVSKDGEFQFGLIRRLYLSIPVTNSPMFAPPFSENVNAGVGFTHQNAVEQFKTGAPVFDDNLGRTSQ